MYETYDKAQRAKEIAAAREENRKLQLATLLEVASICGFSIGEVVEEDSANGGEAVTAEEIWMRTRDQNPALYSDVRGFLCQASGRDVEEFLNLETRTPIESGVEKHKGY